MSFDFYVIIVTLAAITYSAIAKVVQEKLTNKKEMEGIQLESKKLGDEYKEASKRNDKTKIDEITKKQMALFPKMTGMMFGQLKVLAVVLLVFFTFSWAVGYFDPTVKDDINLDLNDNGQDCDETKDGVFSGCYKLDGGAEGEWNAKVEAFQSQQKSSDKLLYFFFNKNSNSLQKSSGNLDASLQKELYTTGEVLKIIAKPEKADSVKAILDSGTTFYVDLPFTIPIVEVKRISGSYWWFIFVSVISSLVFSFIISRIRKRQQKQVPGAKAPSATPKQDE